MGKHLPVLKAIVENKIGKVVIGMLDPNPLVAGRGVKILEEHGIEVDHGYLCEELTYLNRAFFEVYPNKKAICGNENRYDIGWKNCKSNRRFKVGFQ